MKSVLPGEIYKDRQGTRWARDQSERVQVQEVDRCGAKRAYRLNQIYDTWRGFPVDS